MMHNARIKEILEFIEKCKHLEVENASVVISRVLGMLDRISELRQRNRSKKKEISFSLLSLARVDEEANSRILKEILSIKMGGHFVFLESFIKCFFGERFPHNIRDPKFTNEEHRIDILIKDWDYAIILENKICGAIDQNH